ncbi:MAG: AAA family ATPase [Candidatus Omnitrophota bacterium]
MNMKKLPIGVSDFKKIIENDYYYIDKTLLIKEVIDSGDIVLLLMRPRKFGRTLNLSMLRYFYECCPEPQIPDNYKYLFDSLAIDKADQEYLDKLGKHPVIFLSFENIKEKDRKSCFNKLKQIIRDEYKRHAYLLESSKLRPHERDYFKKIIELKGDITDFEDSLLRLLTFVTRFHSKRAVILIDDYDAPIYGGFAFGYYKDISNFMDNFLGAGLKDTSQYLEKGVVTGIRRIPPDSIFSGFNNPGVYTLLSSRFEEYFGFTEEEVITILDDFQLSDRLDKVRSWYNGYRFGDRDIYNPHSISNFINSEKKEFTPYWINTFEDEIVEALLSSEGAALREELEQLIKGESIEKPIDENIMLKEIFIRDDVLWSFLLMGGYLKPTAERQDDVSGKMYYMLSIPNKEVMVTYMSIIDRYFSTRIENKKMQLMLKALIDGDINVFEKMLKEVVRAVCSYHDLSREPEKVYHALVMGLLIWITHTHEVKSNRESGYGRYDIMIIPKDISKIGYVIEFKTVDKDDNETVESALESALTQIEEKKYETELIERGITHIKKLGIAFLGKKVFVKASE